MQPESSAVSEQADTESYTQQPAQSSQHGLRDHDPRVSLSSAGNADAGTTTAATSADQLALDAALAASLQESAGSGAQSNQDRGLSSRNTPSPPARNRIAEYEKASTPPVRKREGPAFEVIKKQRSPNDKRSPILELPNGEF